MGDAIPVIGTIATYAAYTMNPYLGFAVAVAAAYANGAYLRSQMQTPASFRQTIDLGMAGIPVVYGKRKIAGLPVYFDGDTHYLVVAVMWCEGPVYGMTAKSNMLINGTSISDSKWDVYSAGTGLTRDHVVAEDNIGTELQTAIETFSDATFYTTVPATWDNSHRMAGVAHSMVRLIYNDTMFGAGSIPSFVYESYGIQVTDWRTGGDLPAYTVSLHNPIVCLYDYLTSTRYGLGIDSSEIDTTSFTTAANFCDESVTIDGTVYTERYTCDVVLMPESGPMPNVQAILDTCRGVLYRSNGEYHVIIDKPETPSYTFDDSNILGDLSITRLGKEGVFNRVNVIYTDADADYSQQITTVDSPVLRQYDNDALVTGEYRFDGVTSKARAQMLATMLINESRQDIVCTLTGTRETLQCDIGDVVYIKHPIPGWDVLNSGLGKEFRIVGMDIKGDGNIKFSFREYADDSYNWDSVNLYDSAPNTGLPSADLVSIPGGLALTESKYTTREGSGVKSAITLSWLDPGDPFINLYEVFYRAVNGGDSTLLGSTSEIFLTVNDFKPGSYYFKVRARNVYGFRGEFSNEYKKTVLGLFDTPNDMTGLTVSVDSRTLFVNISWDAITDLDVTVGGYVKIKYSPLLTGAAWDTATVAVERVPGVSTSIAIPGAAGTYLAKAYDSSGQSSVNADSFVIEVFPANSGAAVNDVTWAYPWDSSNVLSTLTENASGEYEISGIALLGYATIFPSMYLDTNADGTGVAQWVSITQDLVFDLVTVATSSTLIDARDGNVDDWTDWDGDGSAEGQGNAIIQAKTSTDNGSTWSSTWKILPGPITDVFATDIKLVVILTRDNTDVNVHLTSINLDAVVA